MRGGRGRCGATGVAGRRRRCYCFGSMSAPAPCQRPERLAAQEPIIAALKPERFSNKLLESSLFWACPRIWPLQPARIAPRAQRFC